MPRRNVYLGAIVAAFAAGLLVSHLVTPAHAQAPQNTLTPRIIDLTAMTDTEIGPPALRGTNLRSKSLVVTPQGTVSVQVGDAPKHTHTYSNEIQYVISGSGTFWLGNEQRHIHAGDLIIIPKGTVHAGSKPDSGEFKVLAIKLPPQAPNDMHLVH